MNRISLVTLTYAGGMGIRTHAAVSLSIDGKVESGNGFGVGPIDAAFSAIRTLLSYDATVEAYDVHAPNPGADGEARVGVEVLITGRSAKGIGKHNDTVVASALALVHAFNQHLS